MRGSRVAKQGHYVDRYLQSICKLKYITTEDRSCSISIYDRVMILASQQIKH